MRTTQPLTELTSALPPTPHPLPRAVEEAARAGGGDEAECWPVCVRERGRWVDTALARALARAEEAEAPRAVSVEEGEAGGLRVAFADGGVLEISAQGAVAGGMDDDQRERLEAAREFLAAEAANAREALTS